MAPRSAEVILKNLYPYQFILQRGISDNQLDYSLLLLQVTNTEVIHSPQINFTQMMDERSLDAHSSTP